MQDSCAWKNVYVQKEDLKHKQAQVIFHVTLYWTLIPGLLTPSTGSFCLLDLED